MFFACAKMKEKEIPATGAEELVKLLCSVRKQINDCVASLVHKKRLTKLDVRCLSKKLNAVEVDKPEEEKCKDISENKENTS